MNEWIAINVFGYVWCCHKNPVGIFVNKRWLLEPSLFADLASDGKWLKATMNEDILTNCEGVDIPDYESDPAASDALDDAILERLTGHYRITFDGINYRMATTDGSEISAAHNNKKICRALFAKRIFSK